MKISVIYSSQSGNTELIARAIQKELTESHQVKLEKIDEIKSDFLNDYNLLFVGSPIHAGGLSAPVKKFLNALPENARFKIAGFITHASSAFNAEGYESGIYQLEKAAKNKNISFLGYFHCQGRLAPELHDMVRKKQNASDEEWAEKMAECNKHPDSKDKEGAQEFARKIMSKEETP